MPLHDRLTAFRLASRQLFNGFFRCSTGSAAAWQDEERFSNVEEELFRMLVSDPEGIPDIAYPETQPEIHVRFRDRIPRARWLLNRDGSWEEAVCPPDAELQFEAFFDWDQVGVKDYQYVRVRVGTCPSRIELSEVEALVEYQDVIFLRRGSSSEA